MRRDIVRRFATGVMCALLGGALVACERKESAAPPPGASGGAPTAAAPAVAAPFAHPTAGGAGADRGEFEDELVLMAEGEPDSGPAPLTVRFTVESLVAERLENVRYTWDFGDGSATSNEASPTHTYERPGEYTVTARVVDSAGLRGWDEVYIEVTAPGVR